MNRFACPALLLWLVTAAFAAAPAAAAAPADPRLASEVARQAAAGDFPIQVLVDFEAAGVGPVRARMRLARDFRERYDAESRELSRRIRAARARVTDELARRAPARVRTQRDFDFIPRSLMLIEDAEGLEALLATPGVEQVLPDLRLEPHLSASLSLIQQPTAASSGADGRGTSIVVMDTGVTYTHSDFGSCTAPGIPASCRVIVSQDIAANDGQLDDPVNPHGTNVSAIVAQTAPGTDLIVLDVFGPSGASSGDVTAAYDWVIANAAAHNIRAVNLSLGVAGLYAHAACGSTFVAYDAAGNRIPGLTGNPFRAPIDQATNIGVATITSAGNDAVKNGLPMPACVGNAVAVGAVYDANLGSRSWRACTDSTTSADQVTCFSNSASFLDVLAPGAIITAGGWQYSGTSQAAPHVAAAWAVLASEYPGESIAQRVTRIINGGRATTDAANGITKPRVDFEGMFPPPVNDDFTAASTLSGSSASTNAGNRFANKESGEPSHAGNAGGKSIWWNWMAPAAGTLSLDTAGSTIDTLLAVYTGGAVNGLATVASNDDAASVATSALTATVSAGTTYRIVVDGKSGAWGNVTLNLALTTASADLSAALSAASGPIATGSSISYGLTVGNGGPATAMGVTATLALPGGVVAGTPPAGCVAGSGTVTCTTASLASGGVATWTVPATATAPGTPQATLAVSSATADPNSGNDSAAAQTLVLDPADLSLTLTPPVGAVLQGGTAQFVLQLGNAGPAAASNVAVAIQTTGLGAPQALPAGCSGATGSVGCSLGTLAAGGSAQRTLSFAAGTAGGISLQAAATSSTPEAAPGNETAAWSGSVTAVNDLSVSLSTGNPTRLVPGDPLVLDLVAGNSGPSGAQSVQVVVTLPGGIRLHSANVACTGTTVPTCSLGSIPASGSATASLALDTSVATTGGAGITARVTGTGAVDVDAGNDTASLPIEVIAAANPQQVPALPAWLLTVAALTLGLAGVRMAAHRRTR